MQLAARAGGHVVASVGSPQRGEGLAALGAAEVVTGLDGVTQPVYAALDTVGGRTLSQAYALREAGGCAQSVGMASLEPTSIDFEQARLRGGGRIEAFTVGDHFGSDLAYLIGLVAAGDLDPQVGWRGPWQKAADAVATSTGAKSNSATAPAHTEPAAGTSTPASLNWTLPGVLSFLGGGDQEDMSRAAGLVVLGYRVTG